MNGSYLPPRLLQALGIVLLLGAFGFWTVSGRESVLMVSSAMSLILLGAYRGAVEGLKRDGDKR
jgi:hypothetical protein